MKKIINNLLFGLVGIAVFVACNQDQDVADVMDSTLKSATSITTMNNLTALKEGDTITFDVAVSKAMLGVVDFSAQAQDGNMLVEGEDYTVIVGSLNPYTKTTQVKVIFTLDDFPEQTEKVVLNIDAHNVAQSWRLGSKQVYEINASLLNINDDKALTVAMSWDDTDVDLDILFIDASEKIKASAETLANPEIVKVVTEELADGEYQLLFLPYTDPPDMMKYRVVVGHPDGAVEEFTGVYDKSKLDDWTVLYNVYFVTLSIKKTGNVYSVTFEGK